MKGNICWNEDIIGRVLETEALEVKEHTFLASHTPVKMYREMNTSIAQSNLVPYSESQFLEDFLKRDNYMLATVLGDIGTGKTHLIRWLSARIPSTDKRKVILIPRFGANLRKILQLILEGMEGPQFDDYRQKLKRVDEGLTAESARETLLGNLAIAIGPNGPHKNQNKKLTDEEHFMTESLPALFHDPFFRKILLDDNGIIHALTEHVIGAKDKIQRIEKRRQFTVADLPTNILDFGKASSDARDIYSALMEDDELKEIAVNWINKYINTAISQMLSLQGGDLVNMMNDVRAELAKQEIELVLLFEDFAVVQGIDFQLLEALLVRPNGADKPLCPIRVAIACTTGYYESLRDTIQTRVELKVTLDVETGDMFTRDDMATFVSRYLNVLRYEDHEVQQWYNDQLNTGEVKELPSACVQKECPFIEKCHGSFGNSFDKGLYPFNKQAIVTMYNRLFKEDNPKFNPRTMIKDVIKRTLEDYSEDIRAGSFPPTSMFERFGGKTRNRLTALDIQELESLDPNSAVRREVLLEFWSDSNKIINLPKPIHEAFHFADINVDTPDEGPGHDIDESGPIDESGVNTEPKPPSPNPVPKPTPKPVSNPPQKDELPKGVKANIQAIEMWKNDGTLPQALAQILREHLFDAINDYIDWDCEFLHFISLRDIEGVWKPRHINFERSTSFSSYMVQLVLPLSNKQLNDTAIAFQGMIYYRYYGHWKFDRGSQYYRYFTRYLHRWSEHVLTQIQTITSKTKQEVPIVQYATEILAIGAIMSGRSFGNSVEESIDTLFYPINLAQSSRSKRWIKLQSDIKDKIEEVKQHLFTRIGIYKGQRQPFKLMDSTQLIGSIENVKKGIFTPELGEAITEFSTLLRGHKQIRDIFDGVVLEELQDKMNWLRLVEEAFGENLNIKGTLEDLSKAMQSATSDGSFRGLQNKEQLWDLVDIVESLPIKVWADLLHAISDKETVVDKAQLLGSLDSDGMLKVQAFITTTNKFLEQSTMSVEKDIADIERDKKTTGAVTITEEIEQQFDLLVNVMNGLKRGDSIDTNKSEIISSTH